MDADVPRARPAVSTTTASSTPSRTRRPRVEGDLGRADGRARRAARARPADPGRLRELPQAGDARADRDRRARERSARRAAAAGARQLRRRARPALGRDRRRRCARASSSCTRSWSACSRRPASSGSTADGAPFDPNEHEAVMHDDGDGEPTRRRRDAHRLQAEGTRAAARDGEGDEVDAMAPQREWFEKDYYAVLGVPSGASEKEVTRAYKKLAKQYHPDANPGNKDGRGALQGGVRRVRRARRRREAQGVRRGPADGRVGRVRRRPGRSRWPGGFGFNPGGGRRLPVRRRPSVSATCSAASSTAGGGRRPRRRRRRRRAPRTGRSAAHDLETELHHRLRRRGAAASRRRCASRADATCSTCHGIGRGAGHVARDVPRVPRLGCDRDRTRVRSRSRRCARRAAAAAQVIPDPCPTCHGGGVEVRAPRGEGAACRPASPTGSASA